MSRKIKIVSLFLIFLVTSCVKDVDFESVNTLKLKPTLVGSLFNIELSTDDLGEAVNLVKENNELKIFEEIVSFDFFEEDKADEYLRKIEFDIRANNQFNYDFVIDILFLDASNKLVYDEISAIKVPAKNTNFVNTVPVLVNDSSGLSKAKYMKLVLRVVTDDDKSVLNLATNKKIVLNTALTLFTEL